MPFSDNQRLFLATICAYFHNNAKWPKYGFLDHELMDHEDLDVEDVGKELEPFMFDSPYAPMAGWDPEREAFLSLSALHRCLLEGIYPEIAEDLNALMQAVRLCVDKYVAGDSSPKITEAEVRDRFGMSDLMLRKVFQLMQRSDFFGGSSSNGAPDEPVDWTFTASPIIRRYKRVVTIEDYLAVRQKLRERQAQVPYANPAAYLPYGVTSLDPISIYATPGGEVISDTQAPLAAASQVVKSDGDDASPDKRSRCDEAYEYDVAISFAGPQRDLAERLSTIVKDAGFSVFYDNFYPDHLWGKDLPVFFDEVYGKKSLFCVPFFSQAYVERMWTTWERRSATTRLLQERGKEYILPIVVEHVEVPGIPPTIGYVSLDQYSIEQVAELLIKKLQAAKALTAADDIAS